jgi:DNA-binding NarL/FixJ family response regulator
VAGAACRDQDRTMTDRNPDPVSATPRILVVDSDERVRESLAGLLGIGSRCRVVGSAGHATAALAFIRSHTPDVVVVDPRMPELSDGRAFIATLRDVSPETRIVVMGTDHERSVGDAADAFIRKTFRPRELIEAICAAAAAPPTVTGPALAAAQEA